MRAVLLGVLLAACKKEAAQAPAKPVEAAPSICEKVVDEKLVVVIPKGADAKAAEARAKTQLAKLGGTTEMIDPLGLGQTERFLIKYTNHDITDAELDGIAAAAGLALDVKGEPLASLRSLAPIALDVASSVNGWVLDPVAGSAYTPAQFAKRLPGDPIDVRTQIYVHGVSGDGELPFLDTMGMEKLGLPELTIAAATSGQLEELMVLIDATAQTLVAHPEVKVPGTLDVDLAALPGDWHVDAIRKNGGSARVRWTVRWSADEGHAEGEHEIELVPTTGSGTEGTARLLEECFGKHEDDLEGARADDPELEAAAQRARKELLAMRSHFANGVPGGEQLLVKAPFHENGQTEWMWVEVLTWKGDAFQGTLDNEPYYVKAVRKGSPVTVPFAQVADYLHVGTDGTKAGGYSNEILQRREGSR
jgi:uncharacterized protein YegJ (DUF2314 family)